MKKIVVLISIMLGNITLHSQSIVTDRPDQTESSSTVPKGGLQIEAGVLLGSIKDDNFSEQTLLAPTVLWRYGITRGIELRLLTEFASLKDKISSERVSGITDLQIGTKVQILKKENTNTEIAFLTHLIIPTASHALTINKTGTINKLSIAHGLSENIGLGYNVGYDNFGFGSGNLTYSVALGISITESFGIYLEPYGQLTEFDVYEASFDAGIAYFLQNNFQLDLSFGTGLNHRMQYFSVGASILIANQEPEKE